MPVCIVGYTSEAEMKGHGLVALAPLAITHPSTRIPGELNRAKRRSRNRKVVGSIPGAGMSGGGRRPPCIKGILSGEIAK